MSEMTGCKKCGKTFLNKDAMKGHDCEKILPGTATIKKADLLKEATLKK